MGFYIRKALKVGPLRFNLSKSGIGVSAGVKGLRLGTGPRGNYVHMGQGGIYFRKSLNSPSSGRHAAPAGGHAMPPPAPSSVEPLEEIESGSVLNMVDSSSAELLRELNEKRKKLRLLPGTIAVSVILLLWIVRVVPGWVTFLNVLAAFAACWCVSTQDALAKTTVVFYELEPHIEAVYAMLHQAFGRLRGCSRCWHIEAEGLVRDRKYHAGAGSVVRRKQIALNRTAPPFVKTNVSVPLLPVGKQTLAFMPDRILVFAANGVGAVGYSDLRIEASDTQFVEEAPVPRDARVIGSTWRYVNRNGGPDRRFKDNREIPICAYEQLFLRSATGLNEMIMTSCLGVGADLITAIKSMGDLREIKPGFQQGTLQ